MITSNTPRFTVRRAALGLGCILAIAIVQLPVSAATADAAKPAASADAKKLPLTATFEKNPAAKEGGPQYVLKLKNDSKEALKVSGEILYSVVVHNRPKSKEISEHTVAAGETWTLPEIASLDKITLKAKGYAPLEVVAP